jgi:hypothetical protein
MSQKGLIQHDSLMRIEPPNGEASRNSLSLSGGGGGGGGGVEASVGTAKHCCRCLASCY